MSRRPIPIDEMVQEFKKNHPNSHLLKIDNFSLLAKYGADRVRSSVFDICGRKWKIIVKYNNREKQVSVFLENQDPVDVELKFQVYVVSQLKAEWYPKNNVTGDFSASSKPIQKSITNLMSLYGLERKGFLIEDCCMFGATLPDQETERPGTAECYSLIEKPLNGKVTWMMTKLSSFDPEQAHLSNPFVVGNRKWRIEVHPSGYRETDESFSVYLVGEGFINNEPKAETLLKFKLRVLDQVNRNHVEKTEYDRDDDFDKFMPLSKLCEPYLVKDKLYVGVEFEVISVTKYV
ncbi:uncharacterized protein LOC108827361 isoform X2 [Raphanus sativus]|uniref:Uncharacterized protein LOC108827361 isoform X2 n=1 Tax=Raphanus sativus TaxID=3726 RepID=A0A6J0L9G4_RAPSA|nr:uncharacterized protein LOC108827361 isoform X2 [Raphanus sativus]